MSPGLPQTSGQPLVDEIMQKHAELSPPAQQAVGLSRIPAMAETRLSPTLPPSPEMSPPASQAIPAAAQTTLASPSKVRGFGPLPGSPEGNDAAELQRLQSSPSGIGGIRNPWARHGLQILDALGTAFAPNVAANIPGTELHHRVLLHQAEGNVKNDQAAQAATDTQRMTEARAANEEAMPELNQAKSELAATKIENAADKAERDRKSREDIANNRTETQQSIADAKLEANLRQHQLRKNKDTGDIEPIPYEELTDADQISHDLKEANTQVAAATASLKDAQAKNQPALIENARQRLATAKQNADTAIGRLRLSAQNQEANLFGTVDGKAIPGAPADSTGKPIGLKPAGLSKPTSATRAAGEQGSIIKEAGDKLIEEIEAKKGKVGNLGSYWNQYVNGSPIADPDAAGLMASLSSFAALQPKLHGFRGQAALKEFGSMIGGVPKNPEALKAAIRSIQGTAGIVERHGAMPTVSPTPGQAQPNPSAPAPAANNPYRVGASYGGMKYLGGDPNDEKSWKK